MVTYNDEEYENLLADDEGWSREETDHMFDLLERFDLRFIVVHDRWRGRGRPRHPACAGAFPPSCVFAHFLPGHTLATSSAVARHDVLTSC